MLRIINYYKDIKYNITIHRSYISFIIKTGFTIKKKKYKITQLDTVKHFLINYFSFIFTNYNLLLSQNNFSFFFSSKLD